MSKEVNRLDWLCRARVLWAKKGYLTEAGRFPAAGGRRRRIQAWNWALAGRRARKRGIAGFPDHLAAVETWLEQRSRQALNALVFAFRVCLEMEPRGGGENGSGCTS